MVNRYLRNNSKTEISTCACNCLLVVELECLRELVHELPSGVDELREYGRDLLAITRQETAPDDDDDDYDDVNDDEGGHDGHHHRYQGAVPRQ